MSGAPAGGLLALAVCAGLLAGSARRAPAQAEVAAWGSVPGIRVEGELMAFGGALCVLGPDGAEIARTAKERQRPAFSREGSRRTVVTRLGGLSATVVVEDTGPGAATVEVRFAADSAATTDAGHLCLELPRADYGGGTVQLLGAGRSAAVSLAAPARGGEQLRGTARGVRFVSPRRRLEVAFATPTEVVVRQGRDGIRVELPVLAGSSPQGRSARNRFAFTVSGEVDRAPVALALDVSRPGRRFDGLGGNFRIQNPRSDAPVVEYNLANLRVAWGRVEMPWRSWHPEEGVDPTAAAEAGRLDPRVAAAMEMARSLAQRDVPVIVSAWFPPAWAVLGEIRDGPQDGVWGNALDPRKTERIYASIADYLLYLKRHYGVEAAMFSFNESDLGIDVRQSAREHAAFIEGLGAYLASRGLATRMLLGDTSDATATDFILPAMEDPAARPYIGAVSFHSWRGWSDELLSFWGEAARRLNVPLLVGEGSTDAGAWRYPAIFQEPAFALEEIDLYTRILALAQPLSILQWQLTADYSLLAGGGLAGDSSALRPTQRFWNLKQLSATPAGAFALPLACAAAHLSCAAFGDIAGGRYAVHLVNGGAARPATLTGLPPEVRELRLYVTDGRRGMREEARVPVSGGTARFTLDATSFTTLMGSR